jgi:hypothetical protein
MKFLVTLFLYFCIALLVTQNHLWWAAGMALLFSFRASALWLIPLAIAIDGYFGAFYTVPLFSIVSCLWYAVSELIKPQLIVQYGKAS